MNLSERLRRPFPFSPRGNAAVLSISSPSEPDRILAAKANLEAKGLRITLAENLFTPNGSPPDGRPYLAGSDAVRLAEANRFLASGDWDAFLFARGGYGAMRILDGIDYHAIARNPRPIIGYSDVTGLHQAAAAIAGVGSFHGPMLNTDFFEQLSLPIEQWFWAMLSGSAPMEWTFAPEQVIAPGRGEGVLFGGCLSLTVALAGTPYDYWVDDGIWFWEDIGEPLYRIDRMLTTLRLSGRFRSLRGVMVGKLKECGRNAGEVESLLREFFGNKGVPVVTNLPFGHEGDNLLLPIGALAILDTAAGTLTFPEPSVALQ